MYYWAAPTMPVYPKAPRPPKPKSKSKKKGNSPAPSPAPASAPSFVTHRRRSSVSELFEPAINGPPSAERLRALNKEAKRASAAKQAQSSRDSSLRSRESVSRPSWEQATDGGNLSRQSSKGSMSSNVPSRDRPESVQIFGKTLFNRRNRIKRQSTAQSSSEGSLYSAETASDHPAGKDAAHAAAFSRRTDSLADAVDESSLAQRRFQISGPYNLQHGPDDVDFEPERGLLSRGTPNPNVPPPLALRKPHSPPRRLMKHARSQEQLRVPPPRPPRSPVGGAPLMPPPRLSSRASIRPDDEDAFDGAPQSAGGLIDRPATSVGFRHGQPLLATAASSSSSSQASLRDGGVMPGEHAAARGSIRSDESNWPLPSAFAANADAAALPQVPEEEEQQAVSRRRSKASLRSNHSSLRGSQSVPALRHRALSQQRPSSGASDTLGRFDTLAAPRHSANDVSGADVLSQASWEDDIDYCYEHAAEADCDYAWERSSMEIIRDDDQAAAGQQQAPLLSPANFELPALSPASQASTLTKTEAVTPTMVPKPTFARSTEPLPLQQQQQQQAPPMGHIRSDSQASTFKESHGFNLSPTLLIPSDFRQQMSLSSTAPDGFVEHEELEYPYDAATLALRLKQHRSRTSGTSASTTGSDSERSGLFERHISGTSATTDLSRLTMSTSSGDRESFMLPKQHDRPDSSVINAAGAGAGAGAGAADESDAKPHARSSAKNLMPIVPESEESASAATAAAAAAAAAAASTPTTTPTTATSNGADDKLQTSQPVKRRESVHGRRQRSRAASIPPPPAGQYAIFPLVKMYGNQI